MPLLNIQQQTPEWHDYRKGKIGASLAPIIMEVSPWQTPYQLWEEMLGIREPKKKTQKMKDGLDQEDTVRNLFTATTGISVSPAVYEHDSLDWMFASLDGYSADGKTIVEIKCPNREDHQTATYDKIPEKYFPQIQHQLAVTNAERCFYVSYDGYEIAIVQAYKDESYIEKLIEQEKAFLKKFRTFDAPPMTERDIVSRNDSEWEAATDLYRYLVAYQKNLERRIEKTKNDLIELSQGRNCKGNSISLTKVARKGNIEYSQIPELEKVDLEKYRKPVSSYWKISINGVE